jgi:osmotically-inducible protein OsmY
MKVIAVILSLALLASAQTKPGPRLVTRSNASNASQTRLIKEVRHQLLMLPYYTAFDYLEFKVEDRKVTLLGDVTRPSLKSDAESSLKHLEGVDQVKNEIKVLPPSPMDDRLRVRVAHAIFNADGLWKYANTANPVHIIVENGHLTLKGVVDNQGDKNLINITANGVPGLFSVQNELQVLGGKQAKK